MNEEKTGFENMVRFLELIDKKKKSVLIPLIDWMETLTTSKDLNIQLGLAEEKDSVQIQNPVSWKRFKFDEEISQPESWVSLSETYSALLPTA